MHPDVLVIGGGPAGLATAIAASVAGMHVELAEPQPGAIDKCCGEGLLPPAVAALGALGVFVAEHGSPFSGIDFRRGNTRARASFAASAFGVRRTTLHKLLLARAREVGVRFTAAGARLLPDGRVRLSDGEERRPGWVVGADGSRSAVRAVAGLEQGRIASRRFAVRQHFRLAPERILSSFIEVHWERGAQAYVTPVGLGEVGVAIVSGDKQSNMVAALRRFPALQNLLEGATASSKPRGAITLHRTLRAVHSRHVALVGDASGSVDTVTGDGLSLALGQALALGAALGAGDLAAYRQAHRRLMRLPRLMSRALLCMGSAPAVTAASVGLLAGTPGLFPALLRLHAHVPGHLTSREEKLRPVPA